MLSRGQRAARGHYSFDDRVVREVQEHYDARENAGLLEGAAEVVRDVVLDAHRREDDSVVAAGDVRLSDDLHGELVVAHAGAGEDRELLSLYEGAETVDRRDSGADVVARVLTGDRVYRHAVDVDALFGADVAETVDRSAGAVKDTTEHIARDGQLERVTGQAGAGVGQRDALGALEDLHYRLVALDSDYSSDAVVVVADCYVDHFLVAGVGHAVEGYKRAVYV